MRSWFGLGCLIFCVACSSATSDVQDAGQDVIVEDAGEDAGLEDAGEDAGGGDEGPAPCGEIQTFEDGMAPTKEVHVAVDGSDEDGDGGEANPYASLGRALQDVEPGTAVRLHAGNYAGGMWVGDLSGTDSAPIWIGGAPGEARPVIEGSSQAMHLSRVRYLVLHDLEVRGQSANGINCDDGGDMADPDATRYVIFRGLNIHDLGSGGNEDCLKLSGVDDFFVLDSSFARCGGGMSGSGVDCVGCHRALVAGCTFEENSGNAVQAKGGTTDMEIRGCRLLDPGERGVNMGGSTGFQFFRPPLSETESNAEARRIRVVNNLIVGGTAAVAFVGCVDCIAANNTIVDPERWVGRILQETVSDATYTFEPATGGRFINNLVYFDRSRLSTFVNVGPDTDPDSFQFANNLWYAHDDPGSSSPSLPVGESDGVVGQDPLLSDHKPATGSPACAAGMILEEVDADFGGNCRSTPPAIGAWECP